MIRKYYIDESSAPGQAVDWPGKGVVQSLAAGGGKPLRIKDTRTVDALTGKRIGAGNEYSKDIDPETAQKIVAEAKRQGVDPYTALAISYQETGINKEHPYDLNPDLYGSNYGDPAAGVKSIVAQMQYARRLQANGTIPAGEHFLIQGYNGYGKIKKGHADLEGSTRLYGFPIPEEGIDFKKTPLYGRRILDVRDNILKKNPDIIKMVEGEQQTPSQSTNTAISHGGPPDLGLTATDYDEGVPNKPPTAPKGYVPLTTDQRNQWNSFLDYANQKGSTNWQDAKKQGVLMAEYRRQHPEFNITPANVPAIQYEAYQLRKGESFGNLNKDALNYIRQGLSPAFLNRDVSEIGKLYYPQINKGGKNYGADLEAYYSDVTGTTYAPTTATAKVVPNNAAPMARTTAVPAAPVGGIPRPDYNDPNSRLAYAHAWAKKYGPYMQGRGDTPLRAFETPRYASGNSHDISVAAAQKLNLDPALLYASAMEEGMSGMYKNRQGEYEYERAGQSDAFPVNSSANFGLDQVRSEIKRFQAKGYLPADFQKHIKNALPGEPGNTTNDLDLDSVETALALKAAYMKDNYDDIDSYAKKKGISLSPKARDFFALVSFNAGTGNGHQMLNEYHNQGFLKGDSFLDKRPSESWKTVYDNVVRRVKMADALKKEKLFD